MSDEGLGWSDTDELEGNAALDALEELDQRVYTAEHRGGPVVLPQDLAKHVGATLARLLREEYGEREAERHESLLEDIDAGRIGGTPPHE